jgi:hypothetical protein
MTRIKASDAGFTEVCNVRRRSVFSGNNRFPSILLCDIKSAAILYRGVFSTLAEKFHPGYFFKS